MKYKSLIFVMSIILIIFLAACGPVNENEKIQDSETESINDEAVESLEKLEIFTTIFPLEDFSNKIGGDYVNVINIVPIGAEAHTFEPTPQTMVKIANADAFIYNGAGIEGFADAAIEALANENITIVKATEGIAMIETSEIDLHEEEFEEEAHEEDDHGIENLDPHVWLDPVLSIELAENVKNTLVELMPEASDEFEANFLAVKEELLAIDKEFQEMVESVNKNNFIISHAGFGYWEKRYGIKQIGIAGLSPTNEPSQKQIQEIINFANEFGLNHVIFEQSFTPKVAEVVKEEIGAESLEIHNLEALTEEDINNNEDYFSLLRKNIATLKIALQ